MRWTSEERLELIAMLARQYTEQDPPTQGWGDLMRRIYYLTAWTKEALEENRENFKDAFDLLAAWFREENEKRH